MFYKKNLCSKKYIVNQLREFYSDSFSNLNNKNYLIKIKKIMMIKNYNNYMGVSIVNMELFLKMEKETMKYNKSLPYYSNLNLPQLNDGVNNNAELFDKIITAINKDFHLNKLKILGKRNKLIKDEDRYISNIDSEGFESGFENLLVKNGVHKGYDRLDYRSKVRILEVWYNEMIYTSLEKRSDIFKRESSFYNELSNILSIGGLFINHTLRQVRLERWIIDYENYKIKNIIDNPYLEKSTEAIIYSNLFKLFDKNWNIVFSKYTVNNFRALKKEFKDTNKIKTGNIAVFMLISLGSINSFSIGFKIVMDTVYKLAGCRFNDCVMIIGNHIVNNFIRNLKKEFNILVKENLECYGANHWEFNPIDLYNNLTSVRGKKRDREIIYKILLNILENISEEEKTQIGYTLLHMIVDNCEYIEQVNIREGVKTYINLSFSNQFYDEVFVQSVNTLFLPMICRPILWKKGVIGGYITEALRSYANPDQSIVKSNPKLIKQSNISDKQIDCINYINNVPFKINKFVLSFVFKEWAKEDSILFKGYNKLHVKTSEINSKISSDVYKEIQAHNSIYYQNYNTIMMATLYKDKVFYIPTFLDFRGRLYSKVSYLSYQSGDLARSLLEFYEGNNDDLFKKIKSDYNNKEIFKESFRYIKQYAGNVYKLSKKTIAEKEKWCDNFISEIEKLYSEKDLTKLDVYKMEYDFLKIYLLEADEPFQFVSVFYAIKDVVINKKNNSIFTIPILFDASCSGVQHLASLANDLTVAKMVNVVSEEKTRNDFYSLAADHVREYIANPEIKFNIEAKNKLMKIKVDRNILKLPVMTIAYNVGLENMGKELLIKMGKLVSINNLVEDNVDLSNINLLEFNQITTGRKGGMNKLFLIKINKEYSKTNDDIYLTTQEWGLFASIIYKSVFEIAPSIEKVNHYLNDFMKLMGKCNIPFIWVTPAGMKIKFALGKVITKRAGKGIIQKGSGVQINIIDKSDIDVSKSVTALMPNFIHSLDASCIHELTFDLFTFLKNNIKLEKGRYNPETLEKEEIIIERLLSKIMYGTEDIRKFVRKDNTCFDSELVSNIDYKTILALKNIIPLYTIHDCFATTAQNMCMIKKNVTALFSYMYFRTPYLKIVHNSLLYQLSSYTNIYACPLEYEDSENKIIKKFKNVDINESEVFAVKTEDLSTINGKFKSKKYYLFVYLNGTAELIPQFPTLIDENIYKYRDILRNDSINSTYFIS